MSGRIEEIETIAVGNRIREIARLCVRRSVRGVGGNSRALPLSAWKMVQFIASNFTGMKRTALGAGKLKIKEYLD